MKPTQNLALVSGKHSENWGPVFKGGFCLECGLQAPALLPLAQSQLWREGALEGTCFSHVPFLASFMHLCPILGFLGSCPVSPWVKIEQATLPFPPGASPLLPSRTSSYEMTQGPRLLMCPALGQLNPRFRMWVTGAHTETGQSIYWQF